MVSRKRAEDLARESKFIFTGTVISSGATTLASVTPDKNTLIVRIDNILQAPEILTDFTGKEITVQLSGRQHMSEGQQAVFYTNGWLYGESLAVKSVGQLPVEGDMGSRNLSLSAASASENAEDQQIRQRVEDADLVVQGVVTSVRIPQEARVERLSADSSEEDMELVSEHDPMWREAVIDISDVAKGESSQNSVVVQFPGSTDVRWYKAPKFEAGQEGVFFLHKQQALSPEDDTGGSREFLAAAPSLDADVYIAPHPADFQPIDKLSQVLQAISAEMSDDR
ncbi:MAG TPA: hypothetical protein VGE04_02880 [Chloroflexia bacterium]|jgi:hypothetical protein